MRAKIDLEKIVCMQAKVSAVLIILLIQVTQEKKYWAVTADS